MKREGSAGTAWQEIRVDLRSLQGVSDDLSAEVSNNLRPTIQTLFQQYSGGACFGASANPSVDLHAVKLKYVDCLRATVDRLSNHLAESERLVDAANRILARYQTTDALASASLDDVRQAFHSAQVDGQQGG